MGNQGAQAGTTLGGGATGALLGTFVFPGVGTALGFALGSLVGGIAGRLLFPIDQPGIEGPRLNDLQVQSATYGIGIPLVYGTARMAGNIIWAQDIKETAHESGGGGKGGAFAKGGPSVTTYTYSITLAIGLCRGPITGVRRIWANNELLFDFSQPAAVPENALKAELSELNNDNEFLQSRTRLYRGTETQLPDHAIQAIEGAANTPAYRGLAYMVFENLQLTTEFHNVPPNLEFEVVVNGTNGLTTVALVDTPASGFSGFMAIDPETGYIWTTRTGIYPLLGKVLVIDPRTMTAVKTFDGLQAPYRITYQPPYIEYSLLGEISEVPASMWIGSNLPQILGAPSYRILTANYELMSYALPFAVWPLGDVWFDSTTTNPFSANPGGLGRVLMTSSNGFQLLKSQDPNVDNAGTVRGTSITDGTIGPIADGVFANGYFWGVDWSGKVFRAKRTPMDALTDQLGIDIVVQAGITGSVGQMLNRLTYATNEDMIYVVVNDYFTNIRYLTKLDTDLNIIWRVAYPFTPIQAQIIRYHPGVGDLWLLQYNFTFPARQEMARINPDDGSTIETLQTDLGGFDYWDMLLYPGQPYAYVTKYNFVVAIPLFVSPTPTPPTLQSVVQDLSIQAGLGFVDIDTTALAGDLIDGMVLSDRISVRRAIEPLQRCFYFDGVESDGIIKFTKRGNETPVLTIPSTELAARQIDHGGEGKATAPMARTRVQESELPFHIDVRYMDKNRKYKTTTQYARRLVGQSNRSTTINLPIVTSGTKAKEIGDIALFAAWMSRDRGTITVSRKYLALDPGDVINVEEPAGTTTRWIIVKTDYTLPGLIQLELMRDENAMYTSDLPVVEGPLITETIDVPVIGRLYMLDIPTLRDQDDMPGLYYTVVGLQAGWKSAKIFRSADTGATWQDEAATSTEGIAGIADTSLTWEGSTV